MGGVGGRCGGWWAVRGGGWWLGNVWWLVLEGPFGVPPKNKCFQLRIIMETVETIKNNHGVSNVVPQLYF